MYSPNIPVSLVIQSILTVPGSAYTVCLIIFWSKMYWRPSNSSS